VTANPDPRRGLPAVGLVCADPDALPLIEQFGPAAVTDVVRTILSEARAELQGGPGPVPSIAELLATGGRRLHESARKTLVPVINATGVVIHTNLGRAPLAPEALEAMQAAAGYSSLELSLEAGRRASRQDHLDPLIAEITGAEAGLAVNNCAGAVPARAFRVS
jgi:L-seryl-tRNA(Ser) seleniumtransferase